MTKAEIENLITRAKACTLFKIVADDTEKLAGEALENFKLKQLLEDSIPSLLAELNYLTDRAEAAAKFQQQANEAADHLDQVCAALGLDKTPLE